MSKYKFPLWIAIFLGSVLLAGAVLANGTTSIERYVIGGGGGHAEAGGVMLDGTFGQPVVGIASNSSDELCSGFWCGVGVEYAVYLPLVLKTTS